MKDEKELMAQFGKECSFKTPEGYFEQFHEQLMSNLPDPKVMHNPPATHVSLMTHIKPWLYMAAMFVGIIFVVQGLMFVQQTRFPEKEIVQTEDIYTDEADQFMATSLYNEYSLYSYLIIDEND